MSAADNWRSALNQWGIPKEILDAAPESPWIHPPALFQIPKDIESNPSHQKARDVNPDSVLDIGCGGGIAAFACVPPATKVFGVDHQSEMLEMFAHNAKARNVESNTFLGDWPDVSSEVPNADVVTCHHVVYNVQKIEEFVKALVDHANKRVVIELPEFHPLSNMSAAWKYFWNLERPTSPDASSFQKILNELGINSQMELWAGEMRNDVDFDSQVKFMRIRLCLPQDREAEVRAFMTENPPQSSRKLATIWWDK